jgi:hypothetical protein
MAAAVYRVKLEVAVGSRERFSILVFVIKST